MLKILRNQNGVSTKELLMTLVVMGLMCGLAIVPYNMLHEARVTTRLQAVLQNLETKIRIYKNDKNNFPSVLDNDPVGRVCQNCFSMVLTHLPQQEQWFKVSDTEYLFSAKTTGLQESDFRKAQDFKIEYQPTDGQFRFLQNP